MIWRLWGEGEPLVQGFAIGAGHDGGRAVHAADPVLAVQDAARFERAGVLDRNGHTNRPFCFRLQRATEQAERADRERRADK